MKFSVRSTDLQKALAKTVSVVPSRSTLPILENLLFDVHANTLKVTATDLEISVSVSLEVQGSQNGTIAIPAKRIFDTVRALPDTNIAFTIDVESNKIRMKTDNGEYTLTGESSEEFPSIPEFKGESEIPFEVSVLQKLIGTTLFAVSADELRPAMMGVLIQFSKNDVRTVATDGHRLVRVSNKNIASGKLSKDIIIPAKALSLIDKIAAGTDTKVAISATHVMFKFEGTSLISRLIEEKYPNYESVIPLDNEKKLVVNKHEMLQSVRRVSLYSNSTTHQIRLSVGSDQLKITAEDQDFGSEAKEKISCDYSSDDMEIGFNSGYVVDVLSHLDADEVEFKLSSPNRAAIISPVTQKEGEDVLMLIMPVRLNN
ncbi:MAG: DNA polymerase III subunit beta [Ignavibacteriales bacterium]|nr:DNA polymerase III subunit beta [Ignavibacteriales bacterium]